MPNKGRMTKVLDLIFWIVFLISFVPYLLLISDAIFGGDVALLGASDWEYGFEPVVFSLIIFSGIIPIYPICAIYEILYAIIRIRKSSKARKRIALVLVASILVLVLVPCAFHETRMYIERKQFLSTNQEAIDCYLSEHFSPEFVQMCKVTLDKDDMDAGRFEVRLAEPIYMDRSDFYLTFDENDNLTDNVYKIFGNTYFPSGVTCTELFQKHINQENHMPEKWELAVNIVGADMREFCCGDPVESLFDKFDYTIGSLTFDVSRYDESQTFADIVRFYKTTLQEIKKAGRLAEDNNFNFYVKVNGKACGSFYMIDVDPNDENITLYIRGYTDSAGVTALPYSGVNVDINLNDY